ncbi:MAG: tetraacyldisaccharide 4'-kinase [Cytophagaceae bacterium]
MFLRKIILFPFSFLYLLITGSRNWLYSWGWKKSYQAPQITIGVGNLKVGGTGKTPFTIYLLSLLSKSSNVAMLSRGYGRKTKGYLKATPQSDPSLIGDEPYMVYQSFQQQIPVVVSEDRYEGLTQFHREDSSITHVVLDDVFQHRKIKSNILFLLTEYKDPFFKDMLLPGGMLREAPNNANRADAVIVTKCPEEIQKEKFEKKLYKTISKDIPVFYTRLSYGDLKNNSTTLQPGNAQEVLLVSALGNPKPLDKYITQSYRLIKHFSYIDHFAYSEEVFKTIDTWLAEYENAIIITTEKDWYKLQPFISQSCRPNSWYYLPITVNIENEPAFLQWFQTKLAALPVTK